MIISKKRGASVNFSVRMNGIKMDMCDSYKYLGVYFDKNLNWESHVKYVCKKVSNACGSLAKLRNCLDLETLREVYHALIHSYLRYGLIVWGTATETTLKPIQVLVNRAVRIMCSAPLGRMDVNPLYENLEILKLNEIYDLETGKFMYKKNNDLLPVTIASYLECVNPPQHRYNLRNRVQGAAPPVVHRLAIGERSVQVRGPNLWRDIPEYIKCSESANSFKRLFKTHILSNN